MRYILIIQSLLLIGAAYYIYTLRQSSVPIAPVPTQSLPLPTYSTTTVIEPPAVATTSTSSVEVDIAGPNDAGMEFPTFDGELEVR